MANTLPDVTVVVNNYIDLYVATGLTVGKPLLIQNKGTSAAYIQIKDFQPASSSVDGIYLTSYAFCVVDSGASGCWAKGQGKLSVQEMS